ncbi:hypothetical protein [Halopenitus persicus]|uniref:hypothetical protein n=1 Tax=Halopenitus persicus TaxID=1048396 RepID=UPI001E486E86|nr:hypothetical protein [Halopenitus persicus]
MVGTRSGVLTGSGTGRESKPETTTSRRRLLAATGVATTIGLAGCLGGREGEVPAPTVTDDRIEEDWRLVDETSGTILETEVGPVTVRALEHTTIHEHVGMAEAIAETFEADGSPTVFFATRVDLRPGVDRLPLGIGQDRVMSQVRTAANDAFRSQLRDAGLEDVERTGESTIEVETGHEATQYTYRGSFPLSTEIEASGGTTQPVSGAVEMEGHVAVWHDGTDVLLAGGAYPVERITTAMNEALPERAPDAGTLVENETLAADPTVFEEDVGTLIVAVE